jgi:hypothetical protein
MCFIIAVWIWSLTIETYGCIYRKTMKIIVLWVHLMSDTQFSSLVATLLKNLSCLNLSTIS